ncbi:PRC-barrel domain-containing protein [Maritalea mediterranea]|uniref:PRC-barrel domain-containing protein n=1 Tax=Maritalea mediterranea TaxID=2909667 RepID=A0ABS9E8H6_9HYPH|nr:PRC-barrel domain-containing protein [Maritalea mediterranea]MCF4099185.1 PRC-barrel domain-containing protein [Maritalea mediterranea]
MKKLTARLLTITTALAFLVPAGFADNHTLSTEAQTDLNADVQLSTDEGAKLDGNVSANVDANTSNSNDGQLDMTTTSSVESNKLLASNFLDKEVHVKGEADNWAAIGDVNDVVMDENGNAEWIIVGVGGFLGLGEKEVALSIEDIQWVERDGERIVVTSMTKADLDAAPTFDRAALEAEGEYTADRMSWTEEGQKWIKDLQSKAQQTMQDLTDDSETNVDASAQSETEANVETDATMTDGEDLAIEGQDGEMSNEGSGEMNLDMDWNWDDEGWKTMAHGELSADDLMGTPVFGPDQNEVGEISDVLVTQDGNVTAYIVDVGGFLGLGEKPVALSADKLSIYVDADNNLRVRSEFSQETLEAGPAYSEEEYNNNPDGFIIR